MVLANHLANINCLLYRILPTDTIKMPSIDFYMISAQGVQARLLFACRLLEKAYQKQHQIFVYVGSQEKAQMLNSLLWTFRDDSFVPHMLQQEGLENIAPIQISHILHSSHQDILLNLHSEIPACHHQFNRILEIFTSEPSIQEIAQKHRVFYEEKGYKINIHNLTS